MSKLNKSLKDTIRRILKRKGLPLNTRVGLSPSGKILYGEELIKFKKDNSNFILKS